MRPKGHPKEGTSRLRCEGTLRVHWARLGKSSAGPGGGGSTAHPRTQRTHGRDAEEAGSLIPQGPGGHRKESELCPQSRKESVPGLSSRLGAPGY